MSERMSQGVALPPRSQPETGHAHPVIRRFRMNPDIFRMADWAEQALKEWSDPAVRRYLAPLSVEQRDVARGRAEILKRYLAVPITEQALAEWMTPLITAVESTPDQDAFRGRVAAVFAAIPEMPAVVLNDFALRAALRECGYYLPSASKITRVLEAERSRLAVQRIALAALAEPARTDIPPPRKAPTAEEVAAVDQMLSEWREGRASGEEAPPRPSPSYPNKELLNALRGSAGPGRGGGFRPVGAVLSRMPVRPVIVTVDAETAATPGEGTTTPPEGDPDRVHADHEGQPNHDR